MVNQLDDNPGLKNLLSGELSEEWRITTLGKIARIRRGASPRPIDSPQWFADEGYGWVRITDVTRSNGRLRYTEQYLSAKGITQSVPVKPGQLIMSICATIGEPAIVEFNVCIHDGFVLFDEYDKNLDTNFLYYFLCYWKPNFRGYGQTGTQANLNTDIVASTPILLPPKEEQQQIAKILDTVDKAIAQTETLIAKYKRVKTGLMQDLLTRGIDENGQLRDPKTHKFKRSPLGMIPDEWNVVILDTLCNKITDGSHQSVKTSDHGVPFLYVSCIRDGKILWEETSRISEETYTLISKGREPLPGLILYTAVGSYGHAALVRNDKKFSFQRHIAYILPDAKKVNSEYLTFWLNTNQSKQYADKVAIGNAQKTVTLGEIAKFPILLPGIKEQNYIVEIITKIDKYITYEETYKNKLKIQKAGLMQDLLTGKTSVKPLLTNHP
ncbi:restriction endonuclease subunit S [Nostoc sp. UHCC 0251]|uniref:restriction endonuclease subunit S n=1 Tax=Nostoc sp. UHCC 0251 TaxID=3110240 RepID=UPI002B208309|nr:restriction endonuclease subunit S [Nostoc sp. UHCC 0251]MEA5623507.1 restriction endonuclease subunit S [Nostoc sp. UHCC 0251]